jgi:hypothetical protein
MTRSALWCSAAMVFSAVGRLLCGQDSNAPAAPAATPVVINTDRPAFADSSVVVPKGGLQIENGFQETTLSGQSGFDLPETQLRFGLGDKTELRFSVPDYYHDLFSGPPSVSGWGDSAVGIKQ